MTGHTSEARRESSPLDDYAVIPKALLQDPRLSLAAKGLAAFILSHPAGYGLTEQDITGLGCPRAQIWGAIGELAEAGYMDGAVEL